MNQGFSEINNFTLTKDNINYNITLCKTLDNQHLKIACMNYELQLNLEEAKFLLTTMNANTLDKTFSIIKNLFNTNKITIGAPPNETAMMLLFKINNFLNIEKIVDIYLINKNLNKDFLLNQQFHKNKNLYIKINILVNENEAMLVKYNNLLKDLDNIQKEYNELKKLIKNTEIINKVSNKRQKTKKNNKKENNNIINENNKKSSSINLTKNAYTQCYLDNTFCAFESLDHVLYLIYSEKNKSIVAYNITEEQIIAEIKNAHNDYEISNFRHFSCLKNKKDYLLSISSKIIKLWNINTWECLFHLHDIYSGGIMESACFLSNSENNYILTSCRNESFAKPIKVFDFEGNQIKEIGQSNEITYFIDTYYEKKQKKIYIITGNNEYVKSYDFQGNEFYQMYIDANTDFNSYHPSVIILDNENKDNIVKLVESSINGIIRIWNFHSSDLLNKIDLNCNILVSISQWDDGNIIAACDNNIKLINLANLKICGSFNGHIGTVLTVKKIKHPKYGNCVISQALNDKNIKLWNLKDNKI